MIIILYYAGIGNQMYQHALSIALKKKYPNQEIKVDATMLRKTNCKDENNFSYGLGLNKFFGVDVKIASVEEIKKVYYGIVLSDKFIAKYPKLAKRIQGTSVWAELRAKLISKYREQKENFLTNIPFEAYNGNVFKLDPDKDYYFWGLWQNMNYIRECEADVREQFKLDCSLDKEDEVVLQEIEQTESVCIHMRRGNFTSPENKYTHDLCNMDYYSKALDRLNVEMAKRGCKNVKYFLFSDDEEYCTQQFEFLDNAKYVAHSDPDKSDIDMYMMSKCKYAIIPNSTFAFWAVWLNDYAEKIVICPKYSVRDKNVWHEFSVPDHWIKIDNLE